MTRQLSTEQDIEEVFEYASKEILNGYMFMHKANGYLYFKHTVTRGYIEIPDKELAYPQGGNNGSS